MQQLTELWIGETGFRNRFITDAGVAHLAKLPKLEELELQSTSVTNAGLVHLEGMKNLKFLCLGGSKVTDTSRLQAALPGCKIDR
jgi:Leucine-rich repeat (LRR) protein